MSYTFGIIWIEFIYLNYPVPGGEYRHPNPVVVVVVVVVVVEHFLKPCKFNVMDFALDAFLSPG